MYLPPKGKAALKELNFLEKNKTSKPPRLCLCQTLYLASLSGAAVTAQAQLKSSVTVTVSGWQAPSQVLS
jgi:hypothetical protein